jgi:hypothetical protein
MEGQPTQAIYERMWRHVVEASGIQPEYFHARKGQALIWAANLLHGGMPHRDDARTRWSQVTHYFFEDCAYYTPMMSDPFYGHIDFRELRNIVTGEIMPQRYAGHDVPGQFQQMAGAWAWESFDPALYLQANPDVAAAGANPAEHYLTHGLAEKRRLRP